MFLVTTLIKQYRILLIQKMNCFGGWSIVADTERSLIFQRSAEAQPRCSWVFQQQVFQQQIPGRMQRPQSIDFRRRLTMPIFLKDRRLTFVE
jgi:hypothetical protein